MMRALLAIRDHFNSRCWLRVNKNASVMVAYTSATLCACRQLHVWLAIERLHWVSCNPQTLPTAESLLPSACRAEPALPRPGDKSLQDGHGSHWAHSDVLRLRAKCCDLWLWGLCISGFWSRELRQHRSSPARHRQRHLRIRSSRAQGTL
jgi:hypothetical protein